MSLSAINSPALMDGLFLSGGTVSNYVKSLQKSNFDLSFVPANPANPFNPAKSTPQSNNAFNFAAFNDLGAISTAARLVQSQIPSMAALSAGSAKTATSSDTAVLDATVGKGAPVSGVTKQSVNVANLAAGQLNKSETLTAADNSFGDKFSMSITSSTGKTSTFNVNLAEADNNRTAMQAMAEQINKSDTGVRATVSYNEKDNTVSLSLESKSTGDKSGLFTVVDDSAAKLNQVERSAVNANYTVNGVNFSSESNNNVKITDGVTANLKKEGTTQISYTADTGKAVDSVQNFINMFNGLKDKAASSGELNAQLGVLTVQFGRALSYSGISMDSKGQLSISNENTLRDSIASGAFQRNFQGVNTFGNKLFDISRNAYKTAYASAVQTNFNSFMKSATGNQQSNPFANAGLLFNSWG